MASSKGRGSTGDSANTVTIEGDVQIRPECAGDEAAIHAVTEDAFRDAAHRAGTEQFIVRELRRTGRLTASLVAVIDGRIVGHVAASPVTIDGAKSARWFGLGRVSVVPSWQRRGVGSRLVRAVLERLQARGGEGCVLVGEPAYYGRFGFVRAEPDLTLPDVPPQYFQALCFAGSRPAHGVVTFDPAFEAKA